MTAKVGFTGTKSMRDRAKRLVTFFTCLGKSCMTSGGRFKRTANRDEVANPLGVRCLGGWGGKCAADGICESRVDQRSVEIAEYLPVMTGVVPAVYRPHVTAARLYIAGDGDFHDVTNFTALRISKKDPDPTESGADK
jgi:hypothetical protein